MRIFHSSGAVASRPHGLEVGLDDGWRLRLHAMADDLLRVVLEPAEGLPVDRSWMIAPEGEVPWEGRPRDDMAGFAPPATTLERLDDGATRLVAGRFRVTVAASPLRLSVEQKVGGAWRPWISDRGTGGFVRVDGDRKVRHYQTRADGDRYFGLGDKAGPLDRHGRRFRMLQLDALGYDAEIGDPLYKHVPFVIVRTGDEAEAVSGGLFYDSLAPMVFDMGCERSNYHGFYRYVETDEPGLDLWLIAGPDVAAVTRRFTLLTGRPTLPPRWSFGFSFTSMHHADDVKAQEVIAAFADRCRAEEIPISAIHFGSGYSTRGPRRYVFTWNRDKFPDPRALFAKLDAMGLPTVANIKPVLIDDHPDYEGIAAAGGFVTAESGEPVVEQFWDGMGSYLDFTNPETIRRWQKGLTEQVLGVGFTAGWNDNNEYEIGAENARASGFGQPHDATRIRPLHALLMSRATFEATKALRPDLRPFTVTRAGPAGVQRYAETWSGDNATSWHTLKWNIRNGLSMALSGMSRVGHDIGGFTGPQPDAELLCRFVEMMALHPRSLMNSWKPDVAPDWRAATHPWTHPEVLPQIRAALNLKTTFLPVIYTRAVVHVTDGEPIIRPLFHDFPADPRAFDEHDALMLGPEVLFSPVVERGATTKTQYLPKGPAAWIDFATGAVLPAGAEATVDAPLGRPPIFVPAGTVLVLAAETPVVRPTDAPARRLWVAVDAAAGEARGRHVEDDGVSERWRDGDFLDLEVAARWDASTLEIRLTRRGGDRPIPPVAEWRVETSDGRNDRSLRIVVVA